MIYKRLLTLLGIITIIVFIKNYFTLPGIKITTTAKIFLDNSIENMENLQKDLMNRLETKYESDETERYLIYLCRGRGCGGWADRLKGIVTGYILATITNRTFGINITISPQCSLASVIRPNIINWDLNINKQISGWTKSHHNVVDSIPFYNNNKNLNFENQFKTKVVYFTANLDYIDGLKQNKYHAEQLAWMKNFTRDQIYAQILNKLFTLAPQSQILFSKFLKSARPSNNTQLVCAHIRRGRNPTIPNDTASRSSAEDVQKVWKFLRQYNDTTKYKIFVTSDSEEIVSIATRLFKDQIVFNKGRVVHVDKVTNLNNTEICEDFRKVVVDHEVLKQCDILLISFSGFSRLAAYVRGTDKGLYCLLRNHTGIQHCEPSTLKELYKVLG